MKRILAIILLLCGMPGMGQARSYYFSHYQVEQGLANNAVTCSLLDRNGFIWFGTKDGLCRFDGYKFKVYRRDPANKQSLGNNFIYCLYQNNDGNIWVGTDRGLYLYNYANESFSYIEGSPQIPIRFLARDGHKDLWFIAATDLYRLNDHGRIVSYAGKFTATALCAERGQIWIGLIDGLVQRYDRASDRFIVYQDKDRKPSEPYHWIEKLFCEGPGKLYLGTSSVGVKVFDTKAGSYRSIALPNQLGQDIFVRDVIRSSSGEIWIATESGIFVHNELSGRSLQLLKQYNDPYSLSDNAVYTLCEDREGGIWAGTYFGGINYYQAPYTPFEKYFPKTGTNSISGNAVREICMDNQGKLWIGTEDAGLNRLDLPNGNFEHFNSFDGRSGMINSNIHGLLADGDKLWIGTFEHGLDVMDLRKGRITRHYRSGPKTTDLHSDFVHCLLKTADQKLLIGTARGLYCYDDAKDGFDHLKQVPAITFYTTLMQDSKGQIWAGTFRDGVYVFDLRDQRPKPTAASGLRALNNDRITGLLETRDHQIWITTEAGLYHCTLSGKILKHYTTANGLPSDVLYSLLEDSKGRLWISSSKGLICLDRSGGKLKVFSRSDGLLTDQFNYNSAFKDPRGRMYFGSVKGMISFDPERFIADKVVPPIYITGFQVNNSELIVGRSKSPLKRSIILSKEITLNYQLSTFSIDFSALSFTSPGSTEYAYRMEGLDQQWTYIQKNRRAYFTELPPGRYVFKVKATNSILGWTTGVTELHILITPPFWKSTTAYISYALLLIGAVVISVRTYKQKLERTHQRRRELFENEKEKEIYQAKIDFFTNLAHEIRTPLTLIRVPMEKLMKRVADLPGLEKSIQTMDRNTQRLLSLTDQLLDFRSTETEAFSLSFVKANVSELILEIFTNFQPAAEQKELRYRIILTTKQLSAYIDPEAFTKIISNLIDNGIKYGRSEVTVQLFAADPVSERFSIEVSSNGLPLTAEQGEQIFEPFFRRGEDVHRSGHGLGLAIARALTELHDGRLYFKEGEKGQNIFVMELPIHQLYEFNLQGKWKRSAKK